MSSSHTHGDPLRLDADYFHIYDDDSDDDEYDPTKDDSESKSEDEWINAVWFDKPKYPSANLSSNLTADDIKFMRPIYLIPDRYKCILPKFTDKIYETQVIDGQIGIGLSKYSFKCGLRFPLHPFYDEILDDIKIGLGQLLPNSFLQVNYFINRCQERWVDLQLRLFWHHYKLTTSAKASGFFSLGLKPGSQQWINTNGNNRGSHEAWLYLFGPDMEFYMDWHDYNPKDKNPKLDDIEISDYKKLTKNHDSSMILNSAMLREERFLNGVSGARMGEEELMKKIAEQALAEARLKKCKGKLKKQKSDLLKVSRVKQTDSTSKSSDILVADAKSLDMIVANASLTDLTSSPMKKQKTMSNSPEFTLEYASTNSIALAKSLSSSVTYHAKDPAKLSKMNSLSCGAEIKALASQILLWSVEQEEKSRFELAQMAQLEDAADAAENRATDEMEKASLAEAKVAKFEEDAKAAAVREIELKEVISSLEKELHEAREARDNAEAKWLRVGLARRLEMVKEAKLDFRKCLFPYELKALELEEADDDDDDDGDGSATPDVEPVVNDADPENTMGDYDFYSFSSMYL